MRILDLCTALFILHRSILGCTIGAFSPSATRENRPILWKNRDVSNPDQEMKFFADQRFRFIANVYAGETLDVWAGINEAGFAIINSNSYNLSGDESGADDGTIMRLALGTCALVEDFARLMDSLNIVGRETPANFGVFDATGKTAIFEASHTFYTRYDADEESLGFLLRANFSMSGGPTRLLGKNRFERALALCTSVVNERNLGVEFIIRNLCRDLGQVGFDPYPLPFLSRLEPLPYGYLPTETTICRNQTRSVEIMVGPQPGENPNTGMIWVLLGAPVATLPIPLWVNAGKVPQELDGHLTASLCDEAQKLKAYLCPLPEFPAAINTFRLCRWFDHIAPVESIIFLLVTTEESLWGGFGPDSASATRLSGEICNLVLRTYLEFWDKEEPNRLPLTQFSNLTSTLTSNLTSTFFDVSGRKLTPPLPPGIYFLAAGNYRLRLVLLR